MSDVDGTAKAAVKAKQEKAGLEVQVDVVVPTGDFDVTQPHMIAEAEENFREQVAAIYGKAELTDVRLVKVNHHVGTSATYVYAATIRA